MWRGEREGATLTGGNTNDGQARKRREEGPKRRRDRDPETGQTGTGDGQAWWGLQNGLVSHKSLLHRAENLVLTVFLTVQQE